ncbi:EboA domain-containing protein [uncultured Shewanella sp.]|uniref:EboA domain-containing protein n=1 Tax=uncultured Shewanella sp. TaxID=173975 RepID=UPI0026280208|nr:EboA domain-containing protein [uncultured Shewanella sp.]
MQLNETQCQVQHSHLLRQLPNTWFESTCAQLKADIDDSKLTNIDSLAANWCHYSAQAGREYADLQMQEELMAWQAESGLFKMTLIETIRLQLLAYTLLHLLPSLRFKLFKYCVRYSDDNEKQAVVKGLELLDRNGSCKALIVDLCRTNNTALFAAIALSNAWPAKHFSDVEFEQMLLKALFSDFNIDLIVGLKKRHSQRLSQLAFDYLSERALAQRSWPCSIYSAIDPKHLTGEQKARLALLPLQVQTLLSRY